MPDRVPAPRLPLGALMLIYVIVFVNFAGFSLIIPLLPFYGRELHASPVAVTSLFAAYSFGGIFGELYWGRASDRRGRKPILVTTTALAAVSYVLFAFSSSLGAALAIRVLTGFFSGTMGVCASYIADVTRPEQRARSMGYMVAALNLGFAIGPALGGLLASPEQGLAGFRLPILAAAAVAGTAALWSAFVIGETHRPGAARPLPRWGEGLRFVAHHPLLKRLFVIPFVGIGAFASMEAVFGLWTARNFGWTTDQVGLTFVAVGAAGFGVQLLLIGAATRRFGEARVIAAGVAVLALSMLLQPIIRQPVSTVVLMATLMAGHSLAFPSAGGLISRATAPDMQGSVNGLLMAGNALARILLPPAIGFVYAAAGPDWPYYACAGLAAIALVVALQVVGIQDRAAERRPAPA